MITFRQKLISMMAELGTDRKVLLVSHAIALKCLICEGIKPNQIFGSGCIGETHWDNAELKPLFIDMRDRHFYSLWNFQKWD
jgi:hypothetical protein